MKRLESLANRRIKRIRKFLAGREGNLWLVEGKKIFQEAVDSQVRFDEIFVTEKVWREEHGRLAALEEQGVEIFVVTPAVMKAISDVESSPGLVAIAPRSTTRAVVKPVRFGAFLISIRDPGNFGTMIRAAEAAGCEFLAYTADCVDPYQPKVVRASMGSIFRVPLTEVSKAGQFLEEMKRDGVHVYALSPRTGKNLFLTKPEFPALVVIGSEHKGLPEGVPADETISIPMAGGVESLNVALAAVICFYWLAPSHKIP